MKELSALSVNISEKMRELFVKKGAGAGYEIVIINADLNDKLEDTLQPGVDLILYGYSGKDFNIQRINEYLRSVDLIIPLFICVNSTLEFSEEKAIDAGANGYLCLKEPNRISTELKREIKIKEYFNEKIRQNNFSIGGNSQILEEMVLKRTKELETANKRLLREVSDREKAQSSLKSTESFLSLVLENIPNMIFVKNAQDLTFTYINRAGVELTGFTNEFLTGKTVFELFEKDHADYYYANDQKALLLDKPLDIFEEIVYTKDNQIKLVNTKKILVKDDDGEPTYLIGISDDITDEYATRKELKNSEIRFSKIFHSSPIPMVVLRADDQVMVDVNNSYLKLLGYEKSELIGKTPDDVNVWHNTEMKDRLIDDVIKHGAIKNIEVELVTKQNDTKITLMSFDSVKFNEERLIICMGLDITNRKRIDNELRNALEKQKELNMLRTQFISMISHEFRTPLTGIMLAADLLKRYGFEWDEDEREKHFKRIQETVLKMTQLMENVLLIGRMDSGKFDFHPAQVDLKSFCYSLAKNIEFNTANKHKIDCTISDICIETYIDENLMGLIITNLLTNAVKYSALGDDIYFDVDCNDERTTTFTIRDQGIGIPEKELQHLFKSFYRASNVGSTAGYGLGLYIVKKCVEAHNGVIEVESEVGKGTSFTVTIPTSKADNQNFRFDL